MEFALTEQDLAEIVDGAVTVMLGLDPGAPMFDGKPDTCDFAAAVHFGGDWEGALVVSCDEGFGRTTAAAMFGLESGDVTGEELADALGELANMVAGNAKPMLGAASISLPTVARGSEVHVGVPGAEFRLGVNYLGDGTALTVALYERLGAEKGLR